MQQYDIKNKVAVIAGAGPAGLTAAYELQKRGGVRVIVVEADNVAGGLSRTVCFNGNRMDIGGHRFFSKNSEIKRWWFNIIPLDEDNDTRHERDNDVMLRRHRVSRIFFLRRFFDYPIKVCRSTFLNLGLWRTINVVVSYLCARAVRRYEFSLEDFYINRFGKTLYRLFFEDYTEKVWGLHPSKIDAEWGSQRVKGVSLLSLLKNAMRSKGKSIPENEVETSLIESFYYPKYGPGQLWEKVAALVQENGGDILFGHRIEKVNIVDGKVKTVVCRSNDGEVRLLACDIFFSSMPMGELLSSINGFEIPLSVIESAKALPYRNFITVGLLIKRFSLSGKECRPSFVSGLSDNWIYIQERDVKVGRVQIFNNWSPHMVADDKNTLLLGMEYFCGDGDSLWSMSDDELSALATAELVKIGFAEKDDVIETYVVRMEKAYPAYYGSYRHISKVRDAIDEIDNIYCIGRNGQHRYNNMDHSMLTAIRAVEACCGECDKSSVWSVNADATYNEDIESQF